MYKRQTPDVNLASGCWIELKSVEGWPARESTCLRIPHYTSSHMMVTVSIGVAATLPSDAQRPGDLIEAADAALYAAKHRGRNAVVEHGFVRLTDGGMALAS